MENFVSYTLVFNLVCSLLFTRSIPNKKILEMAIKMKCHFEVSRIDDKRDTPTRRRIRIDSLNNNKVVADPMV